MKAFILGLRGFVRALTQVQTEAVVQGSPSAVNEMINWFWEGSPESRIKAVKTELQELQNFQSFVIKY